MKSLTYIEVDTPTFDGNASPSETTWRFALPTEYLPPDIEAIPSITGVQFNPAVISLGQDLGQRATLTITFKDHRHIMNGEPFGQGTFWGKWRGRYGQKLRAANIRLIRGFLGQSLDEMETRHFIIESTNGPSPRGVYTITAQDVLKLADSDRALAPRPTSGFLTSTLSAVATSFTLSPAGIGNLQYASSGYVNIGGKEVCAFTRVNDAVTITRATTIPGLSMETEVVAHEAGARVQQCLAYTGGDPAGIINDLFVNYANIPSVYIPLASWQLETGTFLQSLYTTLITEPTGVNKLVSELIQQAALAIWWDSLNAVLRLQVLRAVTTAEEINETHFLEGSLTTQDQPATRINEIMFYFALRNPLKPIDQPDNYRSARFTQNEESIEDYNGVATKIAYSRWIPFGASSVADRASTLILSRFADPPRRVTFELSRLGPHTPTDGDGFQLGWTANQNEQGLPELAPIQITRLNPMAEKYAIEAEEMLISVVDAADLQNRVITIDSDINNINLRTLHDNIFPTPVAGESPTVFITFVVAENVIVGSSSTALRACTVGDWPVGVVPTLRVIGRIQGAGGKGDDGVTGTGPGAGGPALYTRVPINLDVDEGQIWGGGGGGGGQNVFANIGGGGGGAGRVPGARGLTGASDDSQPGTSEAGGAGDSAGGAGAGGGPGLAGGAGTAGPGGAAGTAIDGISFMTVTQGPGDIRGGQIN